MWACDPVLTTNIINSYQGVGPLFVQALQTFLSAHCALVGDHLWPPDATEAVLEDPNYDFIVVGAGSAGAVVANRLSEIEHWKVLLVEAGGNPTLATEIPQLFYNNLKTDADWEYRTQPQKGACRAYKNRACAWPRGKTLGGCSSINAMFYVRGNKLDYDEWAAKGNNGWSYEEVLSYFKKSENFSETLTEELKKYHGTGGYLNVENTKDVHEVEKIIMKAFTELGVKAIDDVNGATQMGIARSFSTTKDGVRQSTARAFLSSVRHKKNLHVIKNAYATKILFKSNSNIVSGIVLNKNEKNITVNIKKELILSAGAINTPQILLLSGIGPKKHLKELDIEVVAELPVGEHLQDHVFVPIFYSMRSDKNFTSLNHIVSSLAEFVINKTGPLSDVSPHKVLAFVNTTDPYAISPDVEFHFIFFPPTISNLMDMYYTHSLNEEFYKKFNDLNRDNLVLKIFTTLLKPKSKGRILLNSKDPKDHPLIYPNYFEEPDDLKTLIRATKQYALKLKDTKTFKDAGLQLRWLELDACKGYNKKSDDFIECMARELTFSLYHPTSTARMGPKDDNNAVVDPELKVRHISGLRVIDASIMPSIVRGNTNAPVIMIGEKGADMIKTHWLNIHTEL